MIHTYIICYLIFAVSYIHLLQKKFRKKIKKHLRNFEAENDQKFKKHTGWPKNLVSYKKKNVYVSRISDK